MTIDSSRAAIGALHRVVAHHRDRYIIRNSFGDYDAVLAGRYRHQVVSAEQLPAVGDWVSVGARRGASEIHQITGIRPRRGVFRRKAAGDGGDMQIVAANVDLAIIASALPGDVNLRRTERYLTLAWESGAIPVVVLTKADLVDDPTVHVVAVQAIAPGVDVFAASTVTGLGLSELAALLAPGTTAVLLGSSGVGKSTVVNALLGTDKQRTSAVRSDGAGRHTTTHRELIELPAGASLIDTPGMRELQLWTADDGLETAFDDISVLARDCRFGDCLHDTEPDCAVRSAIERGALDEARLASWRNLKRELAYLERRHDAAATAAARGQIKSLTRAARQRMKEKYE
ncbi:MAG TPA: ribosome small subunit-dependent GTPase A [Gemmatimonadaceae bacterium]|nr:ribosome small subunit-dependent GTPase A [Gemmatimonadaceae bacterium]